MPPHNNWKGILLVLVLGTFAACTHTPVADDRTTLLFTGDVMMGRGVADAFPDGYPDSLFQPIQPLFTQADFVIGNLESPLVDKGTYFPAQYEGKELNDPNKLDLRAPVDAAEALHKAGFTHLSLANNHSDDYGMSGTLETRSVLEAQGIKPLGFNTTNGCAPVKEEHHGNTIWLFAASTFEFGDWMKEAEKQGYCMELSTGLFNQVKQWEESDPEALKVLNIHWGVEYAYQPIGMQQEFAHQMIDIGIDLIIGHHPHMVQSVEFYKGKPIFYSLGNFLFDTSKQREEQGMVVLVDVEANALQQVRVVPISMHRLMARPMQGKAVDSFFENLDYWSFDHPMQRVGQEWVWPVDGVQ